MCSPGLACAARIELNLYDRSHSNRGCTNRAAQTGLPRFRYTSRVTTPRLLYTSHLHFISVGLPYYSYTYTLCIYYIIDTDIYLKIISISYIYYISECIVYKSNIYWGIYGHLPLNTVSCERHVGNMPLPAESSIAQAS